MSYISAPWEIHVGLDVSRRPGTVDTNVRYNDGVEDAVAPVWYLAQQAKIPRIGPRTSAQTVTGMVATLAWQAGILRKLMPILLSDAGRALLCSGH